MTMQITLSDFGVTWKSTGLPALRGIHLSVERGACVLISGPTGCGKTTLLRCLAGLLHQQETASFYGELHVFGDPPQIVNRSEFAPRVGILFQNPEDQLTGLTPGEEVAFGLENLGYERQEVSERIREALNSVSLLQRMHDDLPSLSGGQKQRVALAAVLAMHPDLLLLDEPLSSLDAGSRATLLKILGDMKEHGTTIIICSHEVDELIPLADRCINMEEGSITAEGGAEVFPREPYAPWDSGEPQHDTVVARLEKVTRQFGETFTLGPLTLRLHAGEITMLTGLNGSGKTTLINLLSGVDAPDAGQRWLGGRRFMRLNRKNLADTAVVLQNPDLMLHKPTVDEEYNARCRYLNLAMTDTDATIVSQFGLEPFLPRHPFTLSQGQRQRTVFASAVAGGAQLVLVDEPTTGQDRTHIQKLREAIAALARDGAAVLFSTHNTEAAKGLAHRHIHLENGQIAADQPFLNVPETREANR